MEFFTTESWMALGAIALVGIILAPVVQVLWILRFLMASYVSFCLVLLVPDQFLFAPYASAVFFGALLGMFTLLERGRFFDVTEWFVGRFDVRVFCMGMLTVFFIAAIVCTLLPFVYMKAMITQEVYNVFTEYTFYFSLAPLAFAVLFGRRL